MGRFLTGIFTKQAQPASPPASSLRVQSSIYGNVIPWVLAGQVRISSNLMWYGHFFSVDDSSSGAQGGKGSYFANGTPNSQKFYYASIAFGICQGPMAEIVSIWPHGTPRKIAPWANQFDTTAVDVSATTFLGDGAQMPWGTIQAIRPDQAIGYRWIVYCGIANFPLGPSASLPNLTWEVRALNSYPFGTSGSPDGDPSVAATEFLTDANRGVGFPASRLGDLSLYQSYCLANGLLLSPALTAQVQASSHLIDQLYATNSQARWSGGKLTFIPYGDQPVSVGQVLQVAEPRTIPTVGLRQITVNHSATWVSDSGVVRTSDGVPLTKTSWSAGPAPLQYAVQNGVYKFNSSNSGLGVTISYSWAATASYVPQVTPLYDLTPDDFLPNQGSIGSGIGSASPLIIVRKPRDKQLTSVRVECLDRGFSYNPQPIEVKDEASILLYGRERPGSVKQLHMICLTSVAQFAATQALVRELNARQYQFTLSRFFVAPDPLDILTVTDPLQNIFRQPVRIKEIKGNADRTLTFTCEEFQGTAAAPLFGTEASAGFVAGNNTPPGPLNTPIIFEPTAELLAGSTPEVWAAVSGSDPSWGGCVVWVSTDGGNFYRQLPGSLAGPSRMGVTTTVLPAVAVSAIGQTIDQVSILGVDLTESGGVLASAAAADATSLRTACWIDGEIIAYQTAALVSTSVYNLSFLVRGAFGTEANVVTHPAGAPFARLDGGLYRFGINKEDVGKTIFIKFQAFNLYNDALQALSDIGPVAYTIAGTAYSSPLPTIQNLTSANVDGRLVMSWDEIGADDFRGGIFYEIRAGSTFDGAMTLGIVAHPPFVFPAGTNTYWVTGWCQPLPGVIARSELPVSIAVANAQVTTNILASYDLKALGWPGTFIDGTAIDTTLDAVRTGGSDNILLATLIEIVPLSGVAMVYQERPDHPVALPIYDRPSSSATFAITSGVYVSGTGVVTLTMGSSPNLSPGNEFTISGATGTGSFASINGTWTAGVGTTGATVVFTIATGLTMTITGGTLSLVSDGVGSIMSRTERGSNQPPLHRYITSVYVDPSILESGGEQSGAYDPGIEVGVGRVDTCPVLVGTVGTGVPVGQNILADNDILSDQDILGSASTQFINVYPEIAVAQGDHVYGAWQKFVPGKFTGAWFKVRWQLQTFDPNTIAYLLTATFSVDVPDRVDHPLVNGSIGSGGLTFNFRPDGAGADAPFNGGAAGALGGLPTVVVTWAGTDKATGDFEVVTGLTLSGCTVQIKNALGSGVLRAGVNIFVYGW